jgi:hypothetical protein
LVKKNDLSPPVTTKPSIKIVEDGNDDEVYLILPELASIEVQKPFCKYPNSIGSLSDILFSVPTNPPYIDNPIGK